MMEEIASVRAGEELPVKALSLYLESHTNLDADEIAVEQTYLVRVGKEEYVLRRPPFGNRPSAKPSIEFTTFRKGRKATNSLTCRAVLQNLRPI